MRLPTPTTAAPSSAAPARPEASSCDAASVPSLSPKDNEDSEPDDELQRTEEGKQVDMSKEFADNDPAAKFMKSFSLICLKILSIRTLRSSACRTSSFRAAFAGSFPE
mmetsp:Transcript_18850/g.16115  ORF Transcript_18850/g.16115 Transcript_18850/m.16115 type:complete len:108 (+) Transcript_18850:3-326(+)